MAKKDLTGYASLFPEMEVKQRIFVLTGTATPIRYMIPVKHSANRPLTHFDGRLNRALRWATNQISPFVDEQDGMSIVEPITFENGKLVTAAEQINLQKFIFLHPLYNKLFVELDKDKDAQEDVSQMYDELDAQVAAKNMDINELEGVARVVMPKSKIISDMSSAELRRDMIIWAKNNPKEFMTLLDDENIRLRNVAVRAVEMKILHIKDDNRTVVWEKDKRQKVTVVPYGENVYSGLAAFFKTDEGLDVLQKITNEL